MEYMQTDVETKTASQKEIIRSHIERFGSISSLEAFRLYNITRLSGVMYILRREGFLFESVPETHVTSNGKKSRYARYRSVNKNAQMELGV